MPRRLLGVLILLLVSVTIGRAQGDAVLFIVGADTVSRSEFEYHWKKSSEKHPYVFLQTYGCFKQKIQYARELQLDTLSDYRLQKDYYSQQLIRKEEKRPLASLEREWVKLVHVTSPLSQQADKKQIRASEAYLDSLYAELNKGGQVRVEELGWMQTRYLLDEWQRQLKGLAKNEFSKPFYSPLGIHLIAWTEKRIGTATSTFEVDENLRIKEVEEGLLVAALDTWMEQRVDCSEKELNDFFKQHRNDYGWGTPHFRGAVIHCQDKKEAKRIKKYLKKYPEEFWQEAMQRMPEDISRNCQAEVGMFAIGKNPYVDKLVFKCGDFEPLVDYPYTWVLGKKLKKGPTSFKDVREKVYLDCKKDKKETEMEAIIRKYELEIDEEILKTVNREGNK